MLMVTVSYGVTIPKTSSSPFWIFPYFVCLSADTNEFKGSFCISVPPNRKQVSSKDHDTLFASECGAQRKKEKKEKGGE